MHAVLAVLVTAGLVAGACGSDDPGIPLTISAGETGAAMWFDPADPEVDAGRYEITFDNVGELHHELAIVAPDGDMVVARSIPGGSTMTMEADLSEPGLYQLRCREPGHTEAGMLGTMTVR